MMTEPVGDEFFSYFAEHLFALDTSRPPVFEIFFSSSGAEFSAREGDEFTREQAFKLASLDAPFSCISYLSIPHQLTRQSLYLDLKNYVSSSKALESFDSEHADWSGLRQHCNRIEDYPAVLIFLTVMKQRLPDIYEQALFCAWLGATLMLQLKRSSSDGFNIFWLSLIHDVGLLGLPTSVFTEGGSFDFNRTCTMRKHVIAGVQMLKGSGRISDELLIAVLEHHEAPDGTGYPAGKVGNTIGRLGQCLNFLDAIHAIYNKRLRPGERPLRDLIPMIQMNGHGRFGTLGKKLIEWLRSMPEPEVRTVPNVLMKFLIQAVRERNVYITSIVDVIERLARDIGFRHGDQRVFALQNAIIHINVSITQSGIINSAYIRWLDQVEAEGLIHAYREVEDVYLMMQEVIYHIRKLKLHIECFLSTPCESAEAYKLRKGLERLERIPLPRVHPNLDVLWIAHVD